MATELRRLNFYRPAEEIFEYYKDEPMAAFLDSSLQNEMGCWSIIGLNPYLTLKEADGVCYCNGQAQDQPFEVLLQHYLDLYREENPSDLPLKAGAIGYLSYDFGRKYENIPTRHDKKLDVPEAIFAFYDLLILDDKENKLLYVTARGETEDADAAINRTEHDIRSCPTVSWPARHLQCAAFTPNFEKEDYKHAVDQVISYITEGDIYIMNMTQQMVIDSKKSPYDVYRYLRTYNPAPFGGFFQYGDFQVVSASPERFMLVKDGVVETRPIKGTRKRGATPEEDAALRKELEDSSKDHSELLMIVDLERNDLNHVCQPGSVQVTRHFAVEEYATVFHLVTTIVGQLKNGLPIMDLIEAAFPGGSITGAPKIRSMEIIDELEHDRRNLYTGSMGYFSLDGSCDLNIIIRTAVHKDGKYHLGVGGGITCESDLEFEYEETLQKAKVLLEAMREEPNS